MAKTFQFIFFISFHGPFYDRWSFREKLFAASEDDNIEEADLLGLMKQTAQIEKEVRSFEGM